MPRYRTLSDETILDATITLITRSGVDKLTLNSLGTYIGLSPSTLVQRFGTKQALLAQATEYGLKDMESIIKLTKDQYESPVEVIIAALVKMAENVTTVQEFAHGQAFFQLALTDHKVYGVLQASTNAIREEIKMLLDEAIDTQELKPCNTAELALTVQTTYEGAILTWVIYQEGTVETWVERRINAVIKPYSNISKEG
jgi:AcrR family transcriptional regulator